MIRNATMSDARAILTLVNRNAREGLMLPKSPYAVYQAIPNFVVWEEDGAVAGCCRLAVVWNDLAEIASLAVRAEYRGRGIGRALVQSLSRRAADLKLKRLFTLTYQAGFFQKCGWSEVPRASLPHKVFGECLNCPKVDCCDERAFIWDVKAL
ncbi:MAG: N-acetyltransferase [Alphaproteobacteria bacterium]|nr:N-acetyltransferase [Alphaproteobacteria bacterium]